jgi:hypothetical protein
LPDLPYWEGVSNTARKIEVEITGDSSSLERALSKAGKSSQSNFQKIGKAAKYAGLALGGVLAAGAVAGFRELEESQKVAAQTEAVLKSTGRAAGVTAKQVEDLATSLSKMSGVDDEAIAASENLLLTFRDIRNEAGKGNDIFNQSTRAILDMSVAMGTDLQSATLQVGKALNDPIRGLTALRRVGVSFTKAQEEQIKALVESGDKLGAQKIILRELTKEFGGSAKAAGETLPGQLAKLRNSFDETAGALTEALLPAINAILGKLLVFADWAQKNPKQMKLVVVALGALAAALLAASVAQTALNLAVLANPYVAVIAGVIAFAAVIAVLVKKFDFARDHWQLFLGVLGAGPVIIATVVKAIVRHFDTIKNAVKSVFDFARRYILPIASFFNPIVNAIQTAISWVHQLIGAIRSIPSPGDVLRGLGNAVAPGNPFGGGSQLGGVVRRGGLERVHTGEAIVPARVSRGGAGNGSSGGGWQLALVAIGPDLARELQQMNTRYARGNGGRSIW